MARLTLAVLLVMLCGHSVAQDRPVPSAALPPERVVEIQLAALQHNDEPHTDAGIGLTWAFAHPDNKRFTGPLERFTEMIKGPNYRMLLGHRAHEITRVAVTEDLALYAVTVVPASGPVVFYQWRLERITAGELAGAWMTVAVSPPIERGDAI